MLVCWQLWMYRLPIPDTIIRFAWCSLYTSSRTQANVTCYCNRSICAYVARYANQLYIIYILEHESHSPAGVVARACVMAMQFCQGQILLDLAHMYLCYCYHHCYCYLRCCTVCQDRTFCREPYKCMHLILRKDICPISKQVDEVLYMLWQQNGSGQRTNHWTGYGNKMCQASKGLLYMLW